MEEEERGTESVEDIQWKYQKRGPDGTVVCRCIRGECMYKIQECLPEGSPEREHLPPVDPRYDNAQLSAEARKEFETQETEINDTEAENEDQEIEIAREPEQPRPDAKAERVPRDVGTTIQNRRNIS